jgi:hypothetical protein
MGVVVAFNYANWAALFPEFSTTVTQDQAGVYFQIATGFVRNDGGGPVSSAQTQTDLLNFVTAHLAFLYSGTNTQPSAQLVGRINSAGEGSVNVAADYGSNIGQQMAFWIQSKYGALFWARSAIYRTARYLPGRTNLDLAGPPFPSPWLTGGTP